MARASRPLVSVLMCFRDAAATLGYCLDSIAAQTLLDWELVAVDDGSCDDGAALVARRAARDPRIRLLRRSREGIVPAVNAGLALCRGTWVARMDSDDWMHPERLTAQLAYARAHSHCDLIGSYVVPFRLHDGDFAPGIVRYHNWSNTLRTDTAIRRGLFVDAPLAHPSFFARRAFFERLGGYEEHGWTDDYDFLLRALLAGARFGKVPRVLVRRADRPGQVSRRDPRCGREAMFRAKAHYLVRGPWLRTAEGAPRPVVIAGSGTSGRRVAALLREAGVRVAAFLDNRVGPPGRRVMGIPAWGYADDIDPGFFAAHRGAFLLVCIGQQEGRGRLVRHLRAHGWQAGRDWLRLI